MITFNIVDPTRDDFNKRAVSVREDLPESPDSPQLPKQTAADRVRLAASLRAMIELRGTIKPMPQATKTHTAEELAELGFVSLTLADYGPDELRFRVYEKKELPVALYPDGLPYD